MIMSCPQRRHAPKIVFCRVEEPVDGVPLGRQPAEQAMKVCGLGPSQRILVTSPDIGNRSTQRRCLLQPAKARFEDGGGKECAYVHVRNLRTRGKPAAQPLQPFGVHP